MKNIFTIVGVIMLMSFVFAVDGSGVHEPGTGLDNPELIAEAQGSGQGLGEPVLISNTGEGQKIQLQVGEHIGESGQQMMIQQESNNQMRLEVGGESARTSMKIDQEVIDGKTRLSAQLSNGKNAEIKVMPNAASETALERLRLRTCSEDNGCSIELKEVGAGDQMKIAYEVNTERQSKVFGLFGAKMQVQAQVDAENGEVLNVKKPWWAFLASEPIEE